MRPRQIISILIILLSSMQVNSQQLLWASKVLGFSSQRDSVLYSANEVLHEPNILPQFGASSVAWAPLLPHNPKGEFIHVEFPMAINAEQIAIAENYNPGSVSKVELFDINGRSKVVYTNEKPSSPGVDGRILRIFFRRTPYQVASVKVYLNTQSILGYNQIDAIGISSSSDPIEAKINLSPAAELIGEPENLGPMINSAYDEVLPIISPDGRTLYYTRKNHPENPGDLMNDEIWYSKWDGKETWTKAERMPAPLNNEHHNFLCAISPDGNKIYLGNLYQPDGTAVPGGVSTSERTDSGWTFPIPQKIKDFVHKSRYSEFHIGPSNKTMIIATEADITNGSKDLYVSFLVGDNEWTTPKNLGTIVNSAGNEIAPFLASDGKTVYYSSNGFSGYGKYDLFVIKRLDDTWTNWTKPVNLGPSVNSPGWDAYYSVSASGEYAYFASTYNSLGRTDIFRIKLPEELRPEPVYLVKGKVVEQETGKELAARIIYEDLNTGEELGVATCSPLEGLYQIVLGKGLNCGFRVESGDYYPISASLDLSDIDSFREVQQDFELVPIQEGNTIPLNNIFFKTDSYTLLKESHPELERLVQFLKKNPDLVIEIGGHTNNLCGEKFCLQLSKNRAKAVTEFLIEQGIDKKRVDYIGYGSSRPIADNGTPEGRKRNQRVDFTIMQF